MLPGVLGEGATATHLILAGEAACGIAGLSDNVSSPPSVDHDYGSSGSSARKLWPCIRGAPTPALAWSLQSRATYPGRLMVVYNAQLPIGRSSCKLAHPRMRALCDARRASPKGGTDFSTLTEQSADAKLYSTWHRRSAGEMPTPDGDIFRDGSARL
jgi:hypothetical protein